MNPTDGDFLKRLLATFSAEAEEHLKALSAGFLELEKTPAEDRRVALLEMALREAHSLKGASRAVNRADIEALCQSLEGLLAPLKKKEGNPSAEEIDALHRKVDAITQLLAPPEQATGGSPAAAPPASSGKTPDTLRISTSKLDSLLLQAEEMLAVKMTAHQEESELRKIGTLLDAWKKEWRKMTPRLEAVPAGSAPLMNFLDWNQSHMNALESKFACLFKSAERHCASVSDHVDRLLEDAKQLRVTPFSTLSEILPKLVRDLSHEQGKDVELVLDGHAIEMDRRILEAMKDPLIHLVRNAVDHGIEKPEERVRHKKPARGTIMIAISQVDANRAEILVTDDGNGIYAAAVKNAAVKQKLLSKEDAASLSEAEAVNLIFQSEVSTRSQVTEISGRGLGLAIVREKVEMLGGQVSVHATSSAGTSFRIQVPLTLATLRGILVRSGGQTFVLPTVNVERITRIRREDIKTVGGLETMPFNDRRIPLSRLDDLLKLPTSVSRADEKAPLTAVVLASREGGALVVDEVLSEQELLIKSLSKPLSRLRHIAGVTVLESGKPVPILNVSDLVKTFRQGAARLPVPEKRDSRTKDRRILLAEDSITSRMFLKNILESAGYRVTTAVDGLDAWTTLQTGPFDLVVSDVDMPRMNGFDLTAKIRGDRKLTESPVILVTSRESREDREHGVEVGASAYVTKGHFDQGHLLEMIRRLL